MSICVFHSLQIAHLRDASWCFATGSQRRPTAHALPHVAHVHPPPINVHCTGSTVIYRTAQRSHLLLRTFWPALSQLLDASTRQQSNTQPQNLPYLSSTCPRRRLPAAKARPRPTPARRRRVSPSRASAIPTLTCADPNAPKRGLSAYMFFANEQREKVREDNPGIKFGKSSFRSAHAPL